MCPVIFRNCVPRACIRILAKPSAPTSALPKLVIPLHLHCAAATQDKNTARTFSIATARTMSLRTLGPKQAASLDEELMSTGGFSIDQLMELAGLSVSQAVYAMLPPNKGRRVLVACGPGNNGGDGLVAARHLHFYGYQCTVYYPKQSKNELYQRLKTQLQNLDISFTEDFPTAVKEADIIVDSIFGFSFSGEVREPFPTAIEALAKSSVPVLAVDAPSSWNIEDGPPNDGPGKGYQPSALISLTAPKPLVKFLKGRHFVGGR